jgi:hypothetical protein
LSREVALRACKVAAVVAPVLLLVNHSDLLMTAPLSWVTLRNLALNFAVPYVVSSYSSAATAARESERNATDGRLTSIPPRPETRRPQSASRKSPDL